MGTESNLIFREDRAFYKKLGLALSLTPPLFYIYIFGFGGVKFVRKYGDSFGASAAEINLPENYLAIQMSAILVPIVFFFVLAGFLATRFALQKFQEIENGHAVTYKILSSGFRKRYTRAHIVYFCLATICGLIYKMWFLDLTLSSTPPLPNGPEGGFDYFSSLYRLGKWVLINCVIWLVITLPIAYFGVLVLKLTSLKSESD